MFWRLFLLHPAILKKEGIKISMTENGDPRENAVAERVNGIIKDEYLENYSVNNLKEAKVLVEQWRQHYNQVRPHSSLGYKPPAPQVTLPLITQPQPIHMQ